MFPINKIIRDYGLEWTFYRSLYSLKLYAIRIPPIEKLFEDKSHIQRLDVFDLEIELIEDHLNSLEEGLKQDIIDSANKAKVGKVQAFSSIELSYGYPIDWSLNPLTGYRYEMNKKWFRIPDFSPEKGDIKVVWEISRLTHFLLFSRAYMITKDIEYYEAFEKQLSSWLSVNRYTYGPNYKCGQEATLRMVNVLLAYTVFNHYKLVDEKVESNVKQLVEDSFNKVNSNFFYAYKCINNNHTFSEILGKIIGHWCSNNLKEASRYMKIMDKEITKQFTKDGGYRQYSYNYQRFTLQIIEIALSIEQKLEYEIQNKNIINESIKFMYNIMSNSGLMPNYGSNDGSLILPLSSSDYNDYRPTVNALYAQLNNKNIIKDITTIEETLWFAPRKTEYEIRHKLSHDLLELGTYTYRDDKVFAMIHMNDFKTRPNHMDQLHFELWVDDVEVFCDLGTYSYASKLGANLAKETSHNTVSIPDRNMMNKIGAFLVYDWTISNLLELSERCFHGKVKSKNGYIHSRRITVNKSNIYINDEVSGVGNYSIQFYTPLKVKKKGDIVYLFDGDRNMLKIETEGNIYIEEARRSKYYLKDENVNKIILNVNKENCVKLTL